MDASGGQMFFGLVLGVSLLIFLVLKTKIHTFLALIISAAVTALVGGMAPTDVMPTITGGFGNTLGSIGIVIGFGVMMGKILEASGAAEKLAYGFIKILGKGKEEWAVAATGYIVSIPVFVDSGFIILYPMVKALAKKTKRSKVTLGIVLAISLAAGHHAVPPTPGPLGVAAIFGVDIGQMILLGLAIAIPIVILGILYAKWIVTKVDFVLEEEEEDKRAVYSAYLDGEEKKELPSLLRSILPILIPILLIFVNTMISMLQLTGGIYDYFIFFGTPAVAIGIGLVFAIYGLFGHVKQREALDQMEKGIQSAGNILLVTGAGGALGNVLSTSGAGTYIAQQIATLPITPVLLPFILASVIRLIQGSGTVAMITAASISAPILMGLEVNMLLAAQAAALGSMLLSYFNDSLFWVVNRLIGVKEVKQQMLVWSVPTTLGWLTGLMIILIANVFM